MATNLSLRFLRYSFGTELRPGGLLFLCLCNQLLECVNRRNARRSKRIFRVVPPDWGITKRIVTFAAKYLKHVLSCPAFYLRSGAYWLRIRWIANSWGIPCTSPNPST